MHRSYYEAILQLRPTSQKLQDFIDEQVSESGRVRIAKRKRLRTGLDYYLSSWKFSVALGHLLARRFGGKVEVTKKLFGRGGKKGQIVYRCTVLYRSPLFARGDVVALEDAVFQVTSVGKGRNYIGRNLKTGKKDAIKLDEDWKKLERREAEVSRISPHVEVISPEDYQSVKVENSGSVSGEKAFVVVYQGRVYLVD